ncbi:MAG TPA: DUF1361 domain-containing protein [Gallionellaceae bacterium]
MRSEFVRRVVVFGALFVWCGALVYGRIVITQSYAFAFLGWNLLLAAIPAVAAWLFARAAEQHAHALLQVFWFAIWLVFLPNAPYVITDLVHLAPHSYIPLWYDLAMLASCAGTGLLLGYTSLADVQAVIARRFSARLGWGVAAAALLLSGFGIYLGRFLRWNSWDAFTNPKLLFSDIAELLTDPVSAPQAISVTLVYGFGLLLGYIALRLLQPGLRAAPPGP